MSEKKLWNRKLSITKKIYSGTIYATRRLNVTKGKQKTLVSFHLDGFFISTSSDVARALRMRIPKRNPKHDDAFLNRPDLTQILHFSP